MKKTKTIIKEVEPIEQEEISSTILNPSCKDKPNIPTPWVSTQTAYGTKIDIFVPDNLPKDVNLFKARYTSKEKNDTALSVAPSSILRPQGYDNILLDGILFYDDIEKDRSKALELAKTIEESTKTEESEEK